MKEGNPFYQMYQVLKTLYQNRKMIVQVNEPNRKCKDNEYYSFCEKFPELLSLHIYEDNDDYHQHPPDLLLGLNNNARIKLIKHLKKINKRLPFDHMITQGIVLDRWYQRNTVDSKFDELCKDTCVTYKGMAVLAIVIRTPDMVDGWQKMGPEGGINYQMRENEFRNFRFQSEIKVPVVCIGSSGMRDHYLTQGEIITKKEFESFLRKAKLEHLGN